MLTMVGASKATQRPTSPWASLAVGALIPLLPYLLGFSLLWVALAAGGVGLILCQWAKALGAHVIKGLLAQNLPWAPVLVGVFLAFMAQLAGAHALSWAVGAYLPVSTTAPIWIGGKSEAAIKRTARVGDGWMPSFITPEELRVGVDRVQELAAAAGREVPEDHFGTLINFAILGAASYKGVEYMDSGGTLQRVGTMRALAEKTPERARAR